MKKTTSTPQFFFLSLATLLACSGVGSRSFAQSKPANLFFDSPYARLKKSDAKFECHLPGDLNGFMGGGNGVAKFTLSLSSPGPHGRVRFAVKDVGFGTMDSHHSVTNWRLPALDYQSGFGQILFTDRPQSEFLDFVANYDGPVRGTEWGVGRKVSFLITQDMQSKIVFLRYKDIAVLKKSKVSCVQDPMDCMDSTSTAEDLTYLCHLISPVNELPLFIR